MAENSQQLLGVGAVGAYRQRLASDSFDIGRYRQRGGFIVANVADGDIVALCCSESGGSGATPRLPPVTESAC